MENDDKGSEFTSIFWTVKLNVNFCYQNAVTFLKIILICLDALSAEETAELHACVLPSLYVGIIKNK